MTAVMDPAPLPPEDVTAPARGDLGIKERRAWRTWHLVLAIIVSALLGMALDYYTDSGSHSSTSSGSTGGAYKPPPPAGSTGSSTTTTAAANSSTTSTTTAGGGTGTAQSSTTTSTTTAPAVARILLGPTQSHGNWTSPAFTTTAANWNIGWAFQCTPAPTGGASFQVTVAQAGSTSPGTTAINQTGASGQSVTAESTVGKQVLVVQAPSTCVWAVKVTGS